MPIEFIVFLCVVLSYVAGVLVVYHQANNKMNAQNKEPSPEEARLLMFMIFCFPLYYPEINLIIKHCSLKKENNEDENEFEDDEELKEMSAYIDKVYRQNTQPKNIH